MTQYIKRPNITHAIKFNGENHKDILDFMLNNEIYYDVASLNYNGSSCAPILTIGYKDNENEIKYSEYLVVDFNQEENMKIVSIQSKHEFERKFQKYQG